MSRATIRDAQRHFAKGLHTALRQNPIEPDLAQCAQSRCHMTVRQTAQQRQSVLIRRSYSFVTQHAAQCFESRRRPMRKVSERAPPEFVAVAIALAQQNRRRGIAIRDALNVHGQLESLRFKRVKQILKMLHGKPNRGPRGFTILHQGVRPKTSGNFRLESGQGHKPRTKEPDRPAFCPLCLR